MHSMKYTCGCFETKPPRILLSNGTQDYDSSKSVKLDKALDQLVDSAWNDDDEEADELLGCFIRNLKKDNYVQSAVDLGDILKDCAIPQDSNAILSSLQEYPGEPCHCREVVHRVSIVLNWGLAELHCSKEANEQRLSEVLHQLKPFAEMFARDKTWNTFFQRLWTFSIDSVKSKLTAKLVTIYPKAIKETIEKLLVSDPTVTDSLLDNANFNSVVTLITIPEVFKHVSLHFAQHDSVDPVRTQTLLTAILKALKSNLSKSRFLALYPDTIRSVAAILNEAIDPDDPLLLTLLEQVKRDNFLEFIILVTHFPMFQHLK